MGEFQIERTARLVGLKITLCGAALMLIGAAIGHQFDSAANTAVAVNDAGEIAPFVPSVTGALLTFWGAIRISVIARPLPLAAVGFILDIAANAVPFAAAHVFPEMAKYHWTLPSLLPLFILRIVGLMFFATAVLRLLVKARDKS
jgi:hypothetical protein